MNDIICYTDGFLGSNLQKHLMSRDKKVVGMPIDYLLDKARMHEFFQKHQPYHFYYLAAYGNLHHQTDIEEIYQVIIIKLLNVLAATKDTGCQAFLTAGTTSEYGYKDSILTENMLLEPDSFYGAAKAGATQLTLTWSKIYSLPVIVFRPASMTGVGEQSVHLIPTLIRSCVLGEGMPFIGEPKHDYISVLDVCSALEILSEKAIDHSGEIFNVGTGKEYTNWEVKEMIERFAGHSANITKTVQLDEQAVARNLSQVWMADSAKLKTLGWMPQYSLSDILKEMVQNV